MNVDTLLEDNALKHQSKWLAIHCIELSGMLKPAPPLI